MLSRLKLLGLKVSAFVARDYAEASSYRFAFAMHYVGALFTVLLFYFISGLIEGAASPHLGRYGGSYFLFVLAGLAVAAYLQTSLHNFTYLIRTAQVTGTMEALLVTQTELSTIVLASSAYSFIGASTRVILYIALGVIFFGVNLGGANLPAALLVLLLSIAAFSAIGIVAASFSVLFKRGETFLNALTQLSVLLGGVYFPISMLPDWLQAASAVLPMTYALKLMRYALFQPNELTTAGVDLAVLALFALIALPLSVWIFGRAVHQSKISGSLGHY